MAPTDIMTIINVQTDANWELETTEIKGTCKVFADNHIV